MQAVGQAGSVDVIQHLGALPLHLRNHGGGGVVLLRSALKCESPMTPQGQHRMGDGEGRDIRLASRRRSRESNAVATRFAPLPTTTVRARVKLKSPSPTNRILCQPGTRQRESNEFTRCGHCDLEVMIHKSLTVGPTRTGSDTKSTRSGGAVYETRTGIHTPSVLERGRLSAVGQVVCTTEEKMVILNPCVGLGPLVFALPPGPATTRRPRTHLLLLIQRVGCRARYRWQWLIGGGLSLLVTGCEIIVRVIHRGPRMPSTLLLLLALAKEERRKRGCWQQFQSCTMVMCL